MFHIHYAIAQSVCRVRQIDYLSRPRRRCSTNVTSHGSCTLHKAS